MSGFCNGSTPYGHKTFTYIKLELVGCVDGRKNPEMKFNSEQRWDGTINQAVRGQPDWMKMKHNWGGQKNNYKKSSYPEGCWKVNLKQGTLENQPERILHSTAQKNRS
jgi:hypothetical protein